MLPEPIRLYDEPGPNLGLIAQRGVGGHVAELFDADTGEIIEETAPMPTLYLALLAAEKWFLVD